jgi:hypothetical protein
VPSNAAEHPNSTVGQAADLIHSLADFLKICTLYPASNARVKDSVADILHRVADLRGNRPQVVIGVRPDGFAVDHTSTACDNPNAAWFAECMTETALGSIAIKVDATSESLLTFAKALRDNVRTAKNARSFEDLWSEEIPGLSLSARLLDVRPDKRTDLSPSTRNLLEGDSLRGAVLREFIENKRGSIEQLGDCFTSEGDCGDEETISIIELIRDVLDLLPDSVVADTNRCIKIILELLGSSSDSLAETAQSTVDSAHLEFRRIVLEVSSHFFAQENGQENGQKLETPSAPSGESTGHPGDEKFSDNADEFTAEFAELPDGEVELQEPDLHKTQLEHLGIALYLLQGEVELSASLKSIIAEHVSSDEAPAQHFLCTYLRQLLSPRPGKRPWAHLESVTKKLDQAGLLQYMNRLGIMSPSVVAATFPHTFGSFIDSLDLGDEASGRLIEVCKLVGPTQLLTLNGEDLTPEQRRRVYATRSKIVLPIALVTMESKSGPIDDDDFEILFRTASTGPESAALHVLNDPHLLARQYVKDLCRFESGLDTDAEKLRTQSGQRVHNYIDNPPEGTPIANTVRAIRALRHFWSSSTEALALSLLTRSGLLRMWTRPKPIRDAARAILKEMARCQS